MSPLVKSAVLSFALLAGTAVSAFAQLESIAALPPDAAATPEQKPDENNSVPAAAENPPA